MMKIFDKIYNWFFDRETDIEEDCKMKSKISQIKKHNELERKWRQEFLNNCFGANNRYNKDIDDFENFKAPDYSAKIKYYKRKVKIFHGLQGFKWEYSHKIGTNLDFDNFDNIMSLLGYIEITKEEYEAAK